jgi:hypothetical protein
VFSSISFIHEKDNSRKGSNLGPLGCEGILTTIKKKSFENNI